MTEAFLTPDLFFLIESIVKFRAVSPRDVLTVDCRVDLISGS